MINRYFIPVEGASRIPLVHRSWSSGYKTASIVGGRRSKPSILDKRALKRRPGKLRQPLTVTAGKQLVRLMLWRARHRKLLREM